jgi:hypothetical protein
MSDADKVLEPARAAGLLPPADDDKPPC